jgi:hypothetical protein
MAVPNSPFRIVLYVPVRGRAVIDIIEIGAQRAGTFLHWAWAAVVIYSICFHR